MFRYTVLATDEDTNGIWLGELIRTFLLDADDSIKDGLRTTGKKDAVLDHQKLGTQGGHRVSPLPRLVLQRRISKCDVWPFVFGHERTIAVGSWQYVVRFKLVTKTTLPDKLSL